MATESIKTIKPAGQGGDYSSLAAWEAGEQADLVSLDRVAVGEIDGDWSGGPDTTNVTIDGWTTNIANYVIVRTVNTAKHNGRWDNTKYVHKSASTSGHTFYIVEDYTLVIGIQAWRDSDPTGLSSVFRIARTNNILMNCIARGPTSYTTANSMAGFYSWTGAINNYIINCISFNLKSTGNTGRGITATVGILNVYNCTTYNCYTGYYENNGIYIAKNCLAQNCTDGFNGTISGTNNCSDITSDAPGSNSVTATANFVDVANGDFRLSSNNPLILRAGKDLSSDQYGFNTDIAENYRILYWDIGAHQYIDPHRVKLRADKIRAKRILNV
jgi:hypothetical protein